MSEPASTEDTVPPEAPAPPSPETPLTAPLAEAPAPPPAGGGEAAPGGRGLDLMMDLPLEITVELGRATLTLAEVLTLGPGSVIELDRLPGEPLELLANGRLLARGEVVVLNETFGLRLTEIIQGNAARPAL